MPNNLHLYHMVLRQLCQWLPQERITRMRNLALLMSGLYWGRAVHLSFIVRHWPLPGKLPSLVNRLRRFLDNPGIAVQAYYRPLAQQLLNAFADAKLRLVIDCSAVGFHHRVLTVSVAYRKRTLPLVWSFHRGSKGNITAAEQIELLQWVQSLLPDRQVVWLLGDSGFNSVRLLSWLGEAGWHFVIRSSGQAKVRWGKGGWLKLGHLPLQAGQTRTIGWVHLTEMHDYGPVWLVLHWAQGEKEPWYLFSDQAGEKTLIELYKIRMWIEEMYGDLKKHGFDLESTHLQDCQRLSRLMLGVCLVYVWFIALGSFVVKGGYRHLIDCKARRDKSYFRLGWDWMDRCRRLSLPCNLRFQLYL